MKSVALFAFFVIAVASSAAFDPELNEQWDTFKRVFSKSYKNLEEELERRSIWEKSLGDIVQHNLRADMGLHSFRRGINEYSDMSQEEFVRDFVGSRPANLHKRRSTNQRIKPLNAEISDSIDWRTKGVVTPVKDQYQDRSQCESSWAFSAAGALEAQHKLKYGELRNLSAQNLLDCVEGTQGCGGAFVIHAFLYVLNNKGIATEDSYRYTGKKGPQCLFNTATIGANCTGYGYVYPWGSEEALKQAVAHVGPISVHIDAHQPSFHTYKDGIYDDPKCSDYTFTTAALVVGYGTENGKDYWLVKNSWGTSWGINGYIKMVRNKNNQCGIATTASYPTV